MRVNFNYFISDAVFRYILEAVALVAREGWRLLPHYRFDPATGLWRHGGGLVEPPLSLHDVRYTAKGMTFASHRHREPEPRLADYLAEARVLLADPPGPTFRPRPWPTSSWATTSATCAGSSCRSRPPRSWRSPERRRPRRAGRHSTGQTTSVSHFEGSGSASGSER